MKKSFILLAAAALTLVACNKTVTVAENEGDAITFRPVMTGMTKAANAPGLKTAWETGDILYVTAERTSNKYFQDQFVKDGTGFNSSTKYYWPSDISTNSITFSAFWGAEYLTWATTGDGRKLASAYTVPDAVANQKDLLFAEKTVNARPADGGVQLNFRHMLSQIVVKVANDQPTLKVTVTGVRVGFLNKVGTFAYSGGVTDTHVADASNSAAATLIVKENWTKTDDASKIATYHFVQDITSTVLDGTTPATLPTGYVSWILMPQALTAATAYTTARSTPGPVDDSAIELNGAYIAVKMSIVDKASSAPIVAEQWCYWPIGTTWNPGYRYTYTVNVGSGGYQPTDQDNNTDLDPVLDNITIWFLPTCSIDEWVDENYGVSTAIRRTATYAFADASAQIIDLDAGANGTYDITITGLTVGNTVTATGTGNFTAAPTVSNGGVVPANGTLTISGTLSPNGNASASSVITITDTTASENMTITINQAAPAA